MHVCMEVYDIHFIYFGEVLPVFIDEIVSQCIGKWELNAEVQK